MTYFIDKAVFREDRPIPYRELMTDTPNHDISLVNMKVVVPALLSGSDYAGNLVHRSNFKCFMEDFKDHYGVRAAYGGLGTFAVVLSEPAAASAEIALALAELDDYPLYDEDHHSEMEMEAYEEAWETWVKDDFKRAIEKVYEGNFLDTDADKLSDGALMRLFYAAGERIGEYYINEEGSSMWIDVDRMAEAAVIIMDSYLPDPSPDRRESLAGQLFLEESPNE